MNPATSSPPRNSALRRWIPVILWAGLIFLFSTERFSSANTEEFISEWVPWLLPSFTTADFLSFHEILRKAAHWFEYLVFAMLLVRAQRQNSEAEASPVLLLRSVAAVVAYAASDEYHQSWVPGRTASAVDIAIDALGGICGVLWFYFRSGGRAGKVDEA